MTTHPDVYHLMRPDLVHQLKERKGKYYYAKCGVVSMYPDDVTAWHRDVTCDRCSP
jgi:hypothetical protein